MQGQPGSERKHLFTPAIGGQIFQGGCRRQLWKPVIAESQPGAQGLGNEGRSGARQA
jgi:hypothetical protein